ncbi:hypothetical protein BBMN23_1119 [Bifidobacterium adolescentis]|nr:hypothetical protein BBMN23_1119 [Bifidobacterium adolescentis]
MKELLGLEDSVFISIVCFANRTKFKVKLIPIVSSWCIRMI